MTRLRRTGAEQARHLIDHLRTPLYFNAYALIVSNLAGSALGLLYWTVAARIYDAALLGLSSALISTITFLSGVAQLNLRVALIRLIPDAGSATDRLVLMAYVASLSTTAALATAALPVLKMLVPGTDLLVEAAGPAFGISFVISTMAWTIFNLQDAVLTGLRRTIWVPVENVLYSLAKLVMLVVLGGAMPLLGIIVSWYVPMVVAVVLVTIIVATRWLPAHRSTVADRVRAIQGRALLRFIASDYVAALFALAVSSLLPVLVVARLGPEPGAYFAMVWLIATSLNLVPTHMAASLTVETLGAGTELAEGMRRVLVHLVRLLVPMALVIILGAPLLLGIFGPAYAAGGSDALRLVTVAAIPFSIVIAALALARIRGNGREIVVIQFCSAAGTLVGAVLVIEEMGLTGVALAWLVTQTLLSIVLFGLRIWPLIRGR